MPDLIPQTFYVCASNVSWKAEVTSDGDESKRYTVKFDEYSHFNYNTVVRDYSCTCPYYKHRHVYCKHIKRVKDSRCGWSQFLDGEEPVEKNGKLVCPKCGANVLVEVIAV